MSGYVRIHLDNRGAPCHGTSFMSFLWSGPRASVSGIFRRLMRRSIGQWSYNSMYGNDLRAERAAERAYVQAAGEVAREVGEQTRADMLRYGWTAEEAWEIAHQRVDEALGTVVNRSPVPAVVRRLAQNPLHRAFTRKPAARSSTGGLRGGAAARWARQRSTR